MIEILTIIILVLSNVATYFITRERYKKTITQGYEALRSAHFAQLVMGGQLKLNLWFGEMLEPSQAKTVMKAVELNIPVEEIMSPKYMHIISQAAGLTPEEQAARMELDMSSSKST